MLMKKICEFRTFLYEKIRETEECGIPNWDKAERCNTLTDISELELLDEVFNDYDTPWLLKCAKVHRAEAQHFLDVNFEKTKNLRDSLKMVRELIGRLKDTQKRYSEMDLSEHDFTEKEILEAQEEIAVELEQAQKREELYMNELKEAEYFERLVYVLHRLEGILMNPWYFSYLNRRG